MIGVVAIGRNEGERLRRCLESVRRLDVPTVYVDSGSTDGSVPMAEGLGVEVVHLDNSQGFTAARARNEGFRRLVERHPGLAYAQFVDGDCEVVDGWLDAARRRLDEDASLAVVAGRRRERYPDATIFNKMCDMEWDTQIGEARAVGGDAMYRAAAFEQVDGYDATFICGEEPELCYRLRQAGWRVDRMDREMTLHDAAMTTWGQFWKRMVRSGWAFAEGAAMHGKSPERYNVKQVRSIWVWAVLVPAVIVALLAAGIVLAGQEWPHWWLLTALGVLGVLSYPAMAAKVAKWRVKTRGDAWPDAWLYGVLVMLAKWPQLIGVMKYWLGRWRGKTAKIIEYKGAASASSKTVTDGSGGGAR